VPVKVDREERPDLDRVYQTVCQTVTGSGGWPLSVWLTPDGDPFYVGTYFPPEAKGGRPGFGDVLERVADSWADPEERESLADRAEEGTQAARNELQETPGRELDARDESETGPGASPLSDVADALARSADRERGGFSRTGPKFPSPWRIEALLAAYERTGRDGYRDVALTTLEAMHEGGVYDHLGGGFHRYATDRTWTVPHFEKMLYDNAELARVHLAARQVTGDERYAEVARETFAFVARELGHPEGGFYGTLDARSRPPDGGDPEEGAFYVWTPESVRDALDEGDAELFERRFGVTDGGNFEGRTVLTLDATVEELAETRGESVETVRERVDRVERAAFEARAERPRPNRDEKVLAGWNGLMVHALAEGGRVLGEETYVDRAREALGFVREHLYDPATGRLSRRYADRDGPDVAGVGYLEDYAFLGRGALALYGVTGEVDHLGLALSLAETIVDAFHDPDRNTLYFTPDHGETPVTRPQEPRDQSTPSSLAVALDLLGALDHFRPDDRFGTVVESTLRSNAARLESRPAEHVSLALAADRAATGHAEVTVAADTRHDGAVAVPDEWHRRLAERYVPGLLLAPRPATDRGLDDWLARLDLDEAGPVWADRTAEDGPTAYVCRSFTCSPPQTEIGPATEWLDDLSPRPRSRTVDE
ncbi:thioredoxin domain-containing protein, partial [Halobacteriales archaeon SW_12_71_31]